MTPLSPLPLRTSSLNGSIAAASALAALVVATVVHGLVAATPPRSTVREPTPTGTSEPAGRPTTAALVVEDDLGRSVSISGRCTRLAALAPFAADMALSLGVTPVVVPALPGEPPAAWRGIPAVAVDHSAGPNLEQTVAARPDLIVIASAHAQFVPTLERTLKVPVLVLDVDDLEDVARHQRLFGRLFGREEAAEREADELESAAAECAARDRSSSRVLAIFGTPHAFYGFLPESYLGDLVRRAGGRMVTEGLQSHRVFRGLSPLSMEAIVAKDPEVVLVVFHGAPEAARAMLERDPAWRRLAAVREGRIHVLGDDDFVMHPGREAAAALAKIAAAIDARAE